MTAIAFASPGRARRRASTIISSSYASLCASAVQDAELYVARIQTTLAAHWKLAAGVRSKRVDSTFVVAAQIAAVATGKEPKHELAVLATPRRGQRRELGTSAIAKALDVRAGEDDLVAPAARAALEAVEPESPRGALVDRVTRAPAAHDVDAVRGDSHEREAEQHAVERHAPARFAEVEDRPVAKVGRVFVFGRAHDEAHALLGVPDDRVTAALGPGGGVLLVLRFEGSHYGTVYA